MTHPADELLEIRERVRELADIVRRTRTDPTQCRHLFEVNRWMSGRDGHVTRATCYACYLPMPEALGADTVVVSGPDGNVRLRP